MKRLVSLALLCTLLLESGCVAQERERRLYRATDTYPSGNHNETMTVDRRDRTYILHVPSMQQEEHPLPLLIVLHGTYGTGRKMQLGLGFDSYADERGFYVAYPDAYQEPGSRQTARWNDGRGTLAASTLGIDDVAFILNPERRKVKSDRDHSSA